MPADPPHLRTSRPSLPRPIPPYHRETLASYLYRLRRANALAGTTHAAGRLVGPGHDPITQLAQLTGRPPHTLRHALPELTVDNDHDGTVRLGRPGQREPARKLLACRHCTLARGAGDRVRIWATHEHVACTKHNLWLADTSDGINQLNIVTCPDIRAAIRRHHHLIARHGRIATRSAYQLAEYLCWTWFRHGHRFTPDTARLRLLLTDQSCCRAGDPAPHAALYPTIVALTAILTGLSRRDLITGQADGMTRLLDRIAEEVTDGWRPAPAPEQAWLVGTLTSWIGLGSTGRKQ